MEADLVFTGPIVTLEQVLHSRTRRVERQQALLLEGAPCLVSFTLNIPGDIKQFPLAQAAFQEGLDLLRQAFGKSVLKEETIDEPTGSEALLAVDADPVDTKRKTVAMEDDHPLGRLFDMDVLDPDGRSLSRTELGAPQRTCLLCGNSAKVCGRSRAHSLPELRQAIAVLLDNYFKNKYADTCMTAAWRAMLSEVSATPKPGLVDRNNSGSHRDMDFFTFVDSAAALAPHFRQMYLAGWDHVLDDPTALFARLRALGQQAEADMFATTHGINTHKGLIFSMGLLSGALGAQQ
ncbi:MAG: citrate lyase holo-[Clostridia bacterium]|nr:citrate lyase holo-[acyl-carrier protein] synthase [Clostridia bacterium]